MSLKFVILLTNFSPRIQILKLTIHLKKKKKKTIHIQSILNILIFKERMLRKVDEKYIEKLRLISFYLYLKSHTAE